MRSACGFWELVSLQASFPTHSQPVARHGSTGLTALSTRENGEALSMSDRKSDLRGGV